MNCKERRIEVVRKAPCLFILWCVIINTVDFKWLALADITKSTRFLAKLPAIMSVERVRIAFIAFLAFLEDYYFSFGTAVIYIHKTYNARCWNLYLVAGPGV